MRKSGSKRKTGKRKRALKSSGRSRVKNSCPGTKKTTSAPRKWTAMRTRNRSGKAKRIGESKRRSRERNSCSGARNSCPGRKRTTLGPRKQTAMRTPSRSGKAKRTWKSNGRSREKENSSSRKRMKTGSVIWSGPLHRQTPCVPGCGKNSTRNLSHNA
jgi:hypothetical protein